MERRSLVVGGALVLLGVVGLVLVLVSSLLGINLLGFMLRFWPVLVTGVGLAFVLPPLLAPGRPGLGGLFIPGVPILVTGGILLVASVLDAWGIWAWLWPLEVLAVALGFLAAAIYMRVVWLLIPASIIGLNGLLFQFCAVTGLWNWWAVLWVVEPLSVGLPLLFIGFRLSSSGLITAGLVLAGVAAAGFLLMVTILAGGWLIGLLGPGVVVLVGLGLLGWGLLRHRLSPRSVTE